MRTSFTTFARLAAALAAGACFAAEAGARAAAENVVPCKIHQRERIQFPTSLLDEGVTEGEAALMLEVDWAGQVTDRLVIAYTRPEFADAALAGVKQWRYTPSRIDGEPVNSTITLLVTFQVHGVLAYVRPMGTLGEAFGERHAYRPHTLSELDRVPQALEREHPLYPREWIRDGRVGSVAVEFFIDEGGRVRFPRAIGSPDEFLAAAAVAALREWRFESPLHRGRPVLIKAEQEFHFRPEFAARHR